MTDQQIFVYVDLHDDHLTVDAMHDQQFIEQLQSDGAVHYLPRQRDRIPVARQLHPIVGVEPAMDRQNRSGGG